MKSYKPIELGFCSQRFGENKVDFYKKLGLNGHNGIDFSCPTGTKIHWNCAVNGKVVRAVDDPTKGVGVYVVAEEGEERYMFLFWHNLRNKVDVGDIVVPGQLIAISDNTGLYTTGPHLHWGKYVVDELNRILNRDNGYGGAVDPILEGYTDTFIKKLIDKISMLKRIIQLMKMIIEIKIKLKGR